VAEKFGDYPGITGQLAKIGSMTPAEAHQAVLEAYRTDPTIGACVRAGCSSQQIILVLLALYNEAQENYIRMLEDLRPVRIIIPNESVDLKDLARRPLIKSVPESLADLAELDDGAFLRGLKELSEGDPSD
jgi:hypothetical protein